MRGAVERPTAEDLAGRGLYRHSCPVCGGVNSEARLARGLPCERCLPEPPSDGAGLLEVCRALGGRASGEFARLCEMEGKVREFEEAFESAVGSPPWGAQRTWARRLVRGDSFSIIAPTGVGKTTFGLVAALFTACSLGGRAYLVFPTTTLVQQALRRLEAFREAMGCRARVLGIHSKMPVRARREALAAFKAGEYDVLVTTAAFMRKYAEALSGRFRLVFVDDVDAVLRSARSVDSLLRVVGFTREDLEAAEELLRLQREEARLADRLRALDARIQQLRARARVGRLADRLRRELEDLEKRREELRRKLAGMAAEARRREEELRGRRERAASLIVSSATGRPRGSRVRLFRILLGFEAGGRGDVGFRNVVDSYTEPGEGGVYGEAARLAALLGDGVLVFVPVDEGIEGAERLAEMIRRLGVEAEAYHAKKPLSVLDEFAAGRIKVLVGVANYYGTLVRGLDLPARVKYAVFAGVPRHRFPAEIGEPHPSRLLRLLSVIAEIDDEEVASEARRHMLVLRRIVRRLSPAALQMIAERVLEGDVGGEGTYARAVWEAYNFLRRAMEDERVWDALSKKSDVGVVVEGGRRYLLVPDPATYIQASGRTSRLYAGGITKGLSIVVVDDWRVFRGLMERTRWMADVAWTPLSELDLDALMREIEEERRRVAEILAGRAGRAVDLVKTALLIVESPNKARTIAGFFGRPSVRLLPNGVRAYEVSTGDYILLVAASGGHVYDLAVDVDVGRDVTPSLSGRRLEDVFGVLVEDGGESFLPVYTSIKRCLDCGAQFTKETARCPYCGSERVRDSRGVVEDLGRLAWEVDVVFVGTDPDTEGEKIGWDVAMLIRPYARRLLRMEFHEVTRRAILEALRALREFDDRLVDAQIVRRVEDRWIGFTLSPLLWCDFWPNRYCPELRERSAGEGQGAEAAVRRERAADAERCRRVRYYYNLSAGRVQTPTLGWVVERTEELKRRVAVQFRLRPRVEGGQPFTVKLEVRDVAGLYRTLKSIEREEGVVVARVEGEEWEAVLPPPPPYTTDALLADASRRLGIGAPQAMRLAQDLFELGLITYHRTDSTRVSDKGIEVARTWLEERFGDGARLLFKPRRWGEGGAHEAIRPTRPIDAERLRLLVEEGAIELARDLTRRHYELYDMIFRRFMASQMVEARVRRARYTVALEVPEVSFTLERIVEVPREPPEAGFTLVWDVPVEPRLPVGRVEFDLADVRKVRAVPPLTQGELVQLMKERGIGRPSTYAKIVDVLLRRRYIVVVGGRGRDYVVATLRGRRVYEYLTRTLRHASPDEYGPYASLLRRVPDLVSEERTRELERSMDEIERGVRGRLDVLREIFGEIGGLARAVAGAGRLGHRHEFDVRLAECLAQAYVRGGGVVNGGAG